MIEPIMLIGIGFIAAALLVIGFIPLVHARAVRLTERRLEAATPLSMAEIQADKDQMRAEFAMSTRRLQMSVEQMKAKTTNQLAELGKSSEAVGRLKLELGERNAALFALETKKKLLAEELDGLRTELGPKSTALLESQQALAGAQAVLAETGAKLHESTLTCDNQGVELAALRAQGEALQGRIESHEKAQKALVESHQKEIGELRALLDRKTAEAESLGRQLAEEHAKTDELTNRVADYDRRAIVQTTEAEVLNRRVQELVARLDEQGRSLTDRDSVADRLRNEKAAAQQAEAAVQAALAEAVKSHQVALAAIEAEKAQIADRLGQANAEHARLEREIAQKIKDAEAAKANERTEVVMLRDRVSHIAAEVARLTAALEGPASPINAILAGAANGADGSPPIAPGGAEAKGTLADRIRALQAARVAPAG